MATAECHHCSAILPKLASHRHLPLPSPTLIPAIATRATMLQPATSCSRVFAVSDLHANHKENMEWILSLSPAIYSQVR